jgi:hypothetical protein
LLLGAEVGRGEDFLHAENLHALSRGVSNHRYVLFDVGALNLFDGRVGGRGVGGLYETASDSSCHIKNRDEEIDSLIHQFIDSPVYFFIESMKQWRNESISSSVFLS